MRELAKRLKIMRAAPQFIIAGLMMMILIADYEPLPRSTRFAGRAATRADCFTASLPCFTRPPALWRRRSTSSESFRHATVIPRRDYRIFTRDTTPYDARAARLWRELAAYI